MLLCHWQITRLLHFGCGFLSLLSLWRHSRDFLVPQLLTDDRNIYIYISVHAQVLVLAISGSLSSSGATIPHPVVTAHHRHSLELVLVEVPVIEIAVVTAHAVHFLLLLYSSHQQAEELGILVVVQVNLAVQDAHVESGGPRGTSGSSKKVNLGGHGELVLSPPFSGVTSPKLKSRVFLPEHNYCPLTEKVELGYRTNPRANWY